MLQGIYLEINVLSSFHMGSLPTKSTYPDMSGATLKPKVAGLSLRCATTRAGLSLLSGLDQLHISRAPGERSTGAYHSRNEECGGAIEP